MINNIARMAVLNNINGSLFRYVYNKMSRKSLSIKESKISPRETDFRLKVSMNLTFREAVSVNLIFI